MPTKTINAIILSRKNWGEADRLISSFSYESGKVKFVARGSRKLKSKMAGHIEPFSCGKFFLASGKSFDILAGAEATSPNHKLIDNLNLYKDACYLCELVDLTQEENHTDKELFSLIKECLNILPGLSDTNRKITLRFFEYKLLSRLGYKPNFFICKKCHKKLVEKEKYAGDFEGVFCDSCAGTQKNISKDTLKILRVIGEKPLSELLKIKNIDSYSNDLEVVISPFLYDIIPRPPKTKLL